MFQIESHFLPCLEYFCQLLNSKEVFINSTENFTKQSYRNRSFILGPHKIERLTIPILKESTTTNISNVKISFIEPWQRKNWKTIENCYRKSPFFEFYEPYFSDVLMNNVSESLLDYNTSVLKVCLKLLKHNVPIWHEKENILETKRLNYKKELIFGDDYTPIQYSQNFGNEFVPNLSIIDLLFCKGPESLSILKKSSSF